MKLVNILKGLVTGLGVCATALYINTHPLDDKVDCSSGQSYYQTNGPNAWVDLCSLSYRVNGTKKSVHVKSDKPISKSIPLKNKKSLVSKSVSDYQLSNRYSNFGRVERVSRIEPIYRVVEKKYGIPKNTLGAIVMMESYGGAFMLNVSNGNKSDGGAGWAHMQPGVALHYAKKAGIDFKILGDSKSVGSNYKHGSELKKMFKSLGYNYEKMAKLDSRFDPYKNLIVAAEILKEGKKKYGSWEKAIGHYRGGKSFTRFNYIKRVNKYKLMLFDTYNKKVALSFDKRNGMGAFNNYKNYWGSYFSKFIPKANISSSKINKGFGKGLYNIVKR